jgi:hypothetical protein
VDWEGLAVWVADSQDYFLALEVLVVLVPVQHLLLVA